jgi:hypothetical protein
MAVFKVKENILDESDNYDLSKYGRIKFAISNKMG